MAKTILIIHEDVDALTDEVKKVIASFGDEIEVRSVKEYEEIEKLNVPEIYIRRMKDFEPQPLQQDNKVVSAEQRQVKQEAVINSRRIRPGHTAFEFDLTTGEINPAKIEKVDAVVKPVIHKRGYYRPPTADTTLSTKVIQRENCLYTSALNKKNAVKRFAIMYEKLNKAGAIIRPQNQ